MGKKAQSQIDKELEKRAKEKKSSLMDLFNEQPQVFNTTTSQEADKKAREIIQNSIDTLYTSKLIRKDTKKYQEYMSVPDTNFIIGLDIPDNPEEPLYYCLRSIK